jgi:hypothetical protein
MDNILLKKQKTDAWIYDSIKEEYNLLINEVVVATIDSNGNLKIKGRVLKQ